MSDGSSIPRSACDESGIVPPQGGRPPEWPKKLRTLTAAELDRLTIDNNGRFYWDGKLVNYDTQPRQLSDKPADSLDRSMDILDRASANSAAERLAGDDRTRANSRRRQRGAHARRQRRPPVSMWSAPKGAHADGRGAAPVGRGYDRRPTEAPASLTPLADRSARSS